jgi:hypothetical protein
MKEFTPEYLQELLEREDFSEFVRLHPHIWKHKNLQVDDTNIFSVNTELTAIEKDCLKELVSEEPTYVLVYTNKYGDKQVLFNHHNGTNGFEGNAVNSIKECYETLSRIKEHKCVKWTTLLHYEPDHCDDVYSWFITFVLK